MFDKLALVRDIRSLQAKSRANAAGPKGLPARVDNADGYTGTYEGENLADLGFNHNGVVGTGSGPMIGITRPLR